MTERITHTFGLISAWSSLMVTRTNMFGYFHTRRHIIHSICITAEVNVPVRLSHEQVIVARRPRDNNAQMTVKWRDWGVRLVLFIHSFMHGRTVCMCHTDGVELLSAYIRLFWPSCGSLRVFFKHTLSVGGGGCDSANVWFTCARAHACYCYPLFTAIKWF